MYTLMVELIMSPFVQVYIESKQASLAAGVCTELADMLLVSVSVTGISKSN